MNYGEVKIGERCKVLPMPAFVDGSIRIGHRPPTDQELARYGFFERIAQYIHKSGAVFEGEAYWVRVE